MKKIAYIITRNGSGDFIEDSILKTIADGNHGADVVALYFIENGVYHLIKGSRRANEIFLTLKNKNVKVFASKQSINDKKIKNMMIDGIELTSFESFYKYAKEADHIISL